MSGAPGAPILRVRGLTKFFGGLGAVQGVDFELPEGSLRGLIGPNGAGKTTVFNLITGLVPTTKGEVLFREDHITGLEPHEITRLGIARTFQNIRLFQNLSVLDNVRIAYHPHCGYNLADSLLRTRRFLENERKLTEQALDFLSIFKLEGIQSEIARNLPYGEQRRVEIARALACNPRLLLLDEPAAGMNPREIVELMELIHFIRDRFSLTILLIEHQMRVVMGICESITVMDFGEVIARGTPHEIQNDAKVVEAYLGKEAPLLEVRDLHVSYGAIRALQGISFRVDEGEIVSLIGANGAGKSTTLRTVSGLIHPRSGSIGFKGQDIAMTSAEKIVRLGISHVPEGRKIFAPLTVRENLVMGAYTRSDPREIEESMDRVFASFPRLKERLTQFGGTLSGGEQQMLAMARGLMSKPTLMLLDEPSMGLSPILVEEIFRIIREINLQGTSILLVEQNAQMALSIANRAYVLETGSIVLSGSAREIAENPQVKAAYLGI